MVPIFVKYLVVFITIRMHNQIINIEITCIFSLVTKIELHGNSYYWGIHSLAKSERNKGMVHCLEDKSEGIRDTGLNLHR